MQVIKKKNQIKLHWQNPNSSINNLPYAVGRKTWSYQQQKIQTTELNSWT